MVEGTNCDHFDGQNPPLFRVGDWRRGGTHVTRRGSDLGGEHHM